MSPSREAAEPAAIGQTRNLTGLAVADLNLCPFRF
jgi:hypothetical protein